ncbi:MAG: hypothetical protein IT198_01545 [Acidimicrobiia bacterium]|nr:hypothetical protein [Acidimicrobiia bacterium]
MTRDPEVDLVHAHVRLALHRLRAGSERALLVLHGLGLRTPDTVPSECEAWPGPVWGLDFTGHGASTVPAGGGYTCEALLGDADAALCELGAATVIGYGLGGYVGLQLAGSRPEEVRGSSSPTDRAFSAGAPCPRRARSSPRTWARGQEPVSHPIRSRWPS